MPVGLLVATAGSARQRVRALLDPENPPTRVPSSIEISPSPFSVTEAGTVQLTATVRDQLGDVMVGEAVTWASSASGTASVNASTGLVTGVASGTCTITATASNGTNLSTGANCTVSPAVVASVDLTPTSLNLTVGAGTATFTAQPRDASGNALAGRTVTAPSSDTNLATTSVSGYTITVTPVAAGSPTVTATCETIPSPTRTVTVTATGADPNFPNKPAGLATLLTSRDWSADQEDGWGAKTGGTFRTDGTDAPISPPNVFRQTQTIGAGGTSWGTTAKNITDVTQIYLSVRIRLSSTFQGHTSLTNKLGPWLQIDGGNQLFLNANGVGTGGTLKAEVYIQGVVPSLGGNSASGGQRISKTTGFANIALTRGAWLHWELFVQLNTFNVADGIIRSYIDGVQHVNKTDAALIGTGTQTPGSVNSKITHVKWNGIWGGGGDSCSSTTYVEVDRLDAYGP